MSLKLGPPPFPGEPYVSTQRGRPGHAALVAGGGGRIRDGRQPTPAESAPLAPGTDRRPLGLVVLVLRPIHGRLPVARAGVRLVVSLVLRLVDGPRHEVLVHGDDARLRRGVG